MADPRKLRVSVQRLDKYLDAVAENQRKARVELEVIKTNMPADSMLKRIVRWALSGKGGE